MKQNVLVTLYEQSYFKIFIITNRINTDSIEETSHFEPICIFRYHQ